VRTSNLKTNILLSGIYVNIWENNLSQCLNKNAACVRCLFAHA
jgi:hypothetical protein